MLIVFGNQVNIASVVFVREENCLLANCMWTKQNVLKPNNVLKTIFSFFTKSIRSFPFPQKIGFKARRGFWDHYMVWSLRGSQSVISIYLCILQTSSKDGEPHIGRSLRWIRRRGRRCQFLMIRLFALWKGSSPLFILLLLNLFLLKYSSNSSQFEIKLFNVWLSEKRSSSVLSIEKMIITDHSQFWWSKKMAYGWLCSKHSPEALCIWATPRKKGSECYGESNFPLVSGSTRKRGYRWSNTAALGQTRHKQTPPGQNHIRMNREDERWPCIYI